MERVDGRITGLRPCPAYQPADRGETGTKRSAPSAIIIVMSALIITPLPV